MNSKYFYLDIISPTNKESLLVEWIDVYGVGSNFLVGPDHSPLVSILAKGGMISYKKHEADFINEIPIPSGAIFRVQNNRAVILFDS